MSSEPNKKSLREYLDKHGTYDKQRGDGGDSAAYMGAISALEMMKGGLPDDYKFLYKVALEKHQPGKGVVVRHFDDSMGDSVDWDRGSRDQIDPVQIANGYLRPDLLDNFMEGARGRWFIRAHNRKQNGANRKNHGMLVGGRVMDYTDRPTDLMGPEHWAILWRAKGWWWLFPFIWFCDLFTLGSAVIIKLDRPYWDAERNQNRWKKNITQNHVVRLLNGLNRVWSPVMWLALKLNGIDDLVARMRQHFEDFGKMPDGSWNHIHPMADLCVEALQAIEKRPLWKRFLCKS